MTALTTAIPVSSRSTDQALCTHCGLVVPRGLIEHGATQQFCCAGCRSAFAIIHSCGLDRYYALRDAAEDAARTDAEPLTVAADRSYEEFDSPTFHSLYVKPSGVGLSTVTLRLAGVHCAACVWLVERLPRLAPPGVIESRLDLMRATVTVVWDPARVTLSRIAETLAAIGYKPHAAREGREREQQVREDREHLVRIGVAGACAGNVMLLATCLYAGLFEGIEPETRLLFRWLSMGITLVALAWPGRVFFKSALAAIRTRTPHLDVPISLALAGGGLWSIYATLFDIGEVYYDSLSVLVFLLLVGRFIQHRQQRRAADAVELLYSVTPGSARRIENGQPSNVPVESLKAGDVVEVRPGESVPADGSVIGPGGTIDLTILTGESRPVKLAQGDQAPAGAVCLGTPIRISVELTGEETRVGRLMRLIQQGAQRKAPVVQLANTLSGLFIFGMLGLGAIAAIVWLFIDPARAIEQGVAILVVTCPCALGLATPLVLTVALGRAARRGMFIKGADVVQSLSKPGTMFLDKTGTLTEGRMSVVEWHGDKSLRSPVAAIESLCVHPIATALTRDLASQTASDDPTFPRVEDFTHTIGGGVEARIGADRYTIGSATFLASRGLRIRIDSAQSAALMAERGLTPVLIAVNGESLATVGIGDRPRSETADVLRSLRSAGWNLAILSGDEVALVRRLADSLGIEEARGRLSPEQKLDAVQTAARSGPVVFVGDGVNDAAALAAATVGIAVKGGAEASLAAADVYLNTPGISSVGTLVDQSRRTMRIIKFTLGASFIYNVIAAGGAIAGFVTPLLAAFIMPLSSLTVLAIAIRSRSFMPEEPSPTPRTHP
ncbi:MAG: heavy metal translocating P-type ATPase [Phycisphaeraceae bacterium]|nr:heavy metal translocating P-type ATPase [Phycisphaeraceae bacterium]